MNGFTHQSLEGLHPTLTLGPEVLALMRRREEEQGNLMHYTSNNAPFEPSTPVANIDALWSHLAFVIDPEPWLETRIAKAWVKARFGGDATLTGKALMPEDQQEDTFAQWVAQNNRNERIDDDRRTTQHKPAGLSLQT